VDPIDDCARRSRDRLTIRSALLHLRDESTFAPVLLRPFALAIALVCPLAAALPARAADPFLRHNATVEVVKTAGPAVVNVTTERLIAQASPFRGFNDPFFDRFFQDLFEPRTQQREQSLGSGVLIDQSRHVLTNEHVIQRATRIRVTLADGREFDARLVGADPNNDLAVLRVETDERLPFVAPGSSADVLVGESVIAIGNPFGLSNTVTTGVISAIDRSLRTNDRVFHGFLQTDASINPGNSGGPLLNAEGTLVGINTAIYGGGAQGIGFAIPIDVARRVMKQLIEHGAVRPVDLGLEAQDIDPRLSEVMQLPRNVSGALVSRVAEGGPAARAGVHRGDIITHIDGHGVRRARDLYDVLDGATEGSTLRLGLWRDGKTLELATAVVPLGNEALSDIAERLLGLKLRPNRTGGYVVEAVRANSGSAQIGLRKGDLLLGVNGRELEDETALRRAVLDLRGREQALLIVQRGPGRYNVAVPLG
jgi:serine protease Do